MKRGLTCIECPVGCPITVEVEDGRAVSVTGNSCPRGKLYAENEVICPKRVLTSSVRAQNGNMIPVKTDRPVKKAELFEIMKKVNAAHPQTPVREGDVIVKAIDGEADLIATADSDPE